MILIKICLYHFGFCHLTYFLLQVILPSIIGLTITPFTKLDLFADYLHFWTVLYWKSGFTRQDLLLSVILINSWED